MAAAQKKTAKKAETKAKTVTSTVENLETNKIKLTMTVTPERFREGLQHSYDRNKHYFNIPGFRKGKAPRKILEQSYGADVFHEDAINFVLPDAYEDSLDEHDIDPVYRPEISLGDVSEKEGAVFFAEVFTRPTAEIDDYYGLTYPKGEVEPTEDEIQQELSNQQEKNARQVSIDRPAEMGDITLINFKGFIDDEPFEGGEGEDFSLTLGSGQFIPGFEDQLVGKTPGDDVKVNVTFPEEYHAPEYAGKDAVFEVEILDVQAKEFPEIDDDFAQDVSEFDTLAEYREDITKRIKEHKEANIDNYKRNHILKQLVSKSTVEIPEAMFLGRLDEMMDDFSRQIQMQGMNVENYMRFTQMTPDSLKASWRPQAEIDVKNLLALEAVSKKENLAVDDSEFEEKVKEMLKFEGEQLKEFLKTLPPGRKKELERSMLNEKALELVIEKATAIDGPLPMEEIVVDEE